MEICYVMWKCCLQQWKTEMEEEIQAYPKVPENKHYYLTEQSALQVVCIW